MIKLLIIIVTYNGMKWLDKCLSSVVNSTIPVSLFIVDNGSTDGSIEFIKENYPQAYFIESKQNLGFGRANNLGLKYALDNGYDYVYLLNQDAWVEPDVFEKLILIHKESSEYGLLSPLQLNGSLSAFDKNFLLQCPRTMISDLICSVLSRIYETEFVMAAHWLLPLDTIKTIGGFSPTFKHYGEDGEYVNRIRFFGMKIGIVPQCHAVHDREFRQMDNNGKQYKFYTDNLVMLSNPNVNKRLLRLFNSYLQSIFKDNEAINIRLFFDIIKDMSSISRNREIAKKGFAFLH